MHLSLSSRTHTVFPRMISGGDYFFFRQKGGDYSRETIILRIPSKGCDYSWEAINRGTAIIRRNRVYIHTGKKINFSFGAECEHDALSWNVNFCPFSLAKSPPRDRQ